MFHFCGNRATTKPARCPATNTTLPRTGVREKAAAGLPEASPRGFAEVMGLLQPGEEAEVELLPQEISVPTVSMDAGLIVRSKDQFVAIFDAFGGRPDRALDPVLEYAKGADTKFALPIRV